MAVSFARSLFLLAVISVLSSVTEAGLAAAPYLATPVSFPVPLAYTIPSQGVLRTTYNQVVGRSYAPSFVPVASSLAYAATPVVAPVVKAVPTVYAVPPQLVAGPVLKTVRPVGIPLSYAAPTGAAVAPVVRAVGAPEPVFTPSVLTTRLAQLPAVGVAPALTPALAATPATSLPGVIDARSAAPVPSGPPATNGQRAFVTAFGSREGIQLVGVGSAFEGAPTNVEIARSAPGEQGDGAQQERSASPAVPASTMPETFGAQPQTPFNEYGLPASAGAPVNL